MTAPAPILPQDRIILRQFPGDVVPEPTGSPEDFERLAGTLEEIAKELNGYAQAMGPALPLPVPLQEVQACPE